MATLSVRKIAADYLGTTVPLSLRQDIFGVYSNESHSLKSQLDVLQKRRFGRYELRGYLTTEYGARDCNRCVNNVLVALAALDTNKRDSHGFKFNTSVSGTDRVGLLSHAQGVARIPGVGRENWLVFSKHDQNHPEEAGLIFVEYPGVQSDGRAWAHAARTSDEGQARYFYTNRDSDHLGGLQVSGRLLAVGTDCAEHPICHERAWVDFYEVSEPWNLRRCGRLILDGRNGEPRQSPPGEVPPGASPSKAHYVALTKLADGRFLLFVVGPDDTYGWLYTSSKNTISTDTKWHFRQLWDKSATLPRPSNWDIYQSGNFVTECGTGHIYFIGMKEDGPPHRKNRVDLFRIETTGEGQVVFRLIQRQTVWTRVGGATLRAAGCLHVTPDGGLVLYAIEKAQGLSANWMTLEEFRDK